ncbi:MAG: transcriptional repressor [Dehalococcoidaceae bacterium]|nr:transcriptional repressor [Dehalococcoidaceae bacterium]
MSYTYKDIISTLRRTGCKITPQRRQIIKVLQSSTSHLTPAEVFEKVNCNSSGTGMVTIYRTLEMLEKADLVCRFNLNNGHTGYLIRRPHQHHHHLLCNRCGLVIDLEDCHLEKLVKQVGADTGFTITEHSFELTGICPGCQQAENDARSSRVGIST